MKTLTSISKFALLPLLSLASLNGWASAQAQLRETTELNHAGSYSNYLRIDGHVEGEPASFAFLVVGTTLFEAEILEASGLRVMPELVVPLGQFKADMARIWLPDNLPAGIYAQVLVMTDDARHFSSSNWLELERAAEGQPGNGTPKDGEAGSGQDGGVAGEPRDRGGAAGSR
ncbi:MAG: hypothetical protein ACE5F1_00785 [Planctomycetota bacterium]